MSNASFFSVMPWETAPGSFPPWPASMMTVLKFLGPGLWPSGSLVLFDDLEVIVFLTGVILVGCSGRGDRI